MDPYARESRRQVYIKKDTISYLVTASECVLWNDVVTKAASKGGSRLTWRPPKDFYTVSGGNLHSDSRGLFAKYLGHKVVFRNKLNGPLRIKATVPVGKISDPTKIFARPVVVDKSAEPAGHKKDLSRRSGKKGTKNYSKSTDRIEINVTEKQLFSGDANLYTLFKEKLPGDKAVNPSYYADGFALLDYIPILPNENQYSGEKFSSDLIVMEIIIVVRYMISRLVHADGAQSVDGILNFQRGQLANFDAVFHVDADEYYLNHGLVMGSVRPGGTLMKQFDDRGYPYVGVNFLKDKKHFALYYYDQVGEPIEPASLKAFEHSQHRVVIPAIQINQDVGEVAGTEFGYSYQDQCWVQYEGSKPRVVLKQKPQCGSPISVSTPVYIYSVVRPHHPGAPTAQAGLIRNYGAELTYAISWNQIAEGLSTVIKVLEWAAFIGGTLFG